MKMNTYYRNADGTYYNKPENFWGFPPENKGIICHCEKEKNVYEDVLIDVIDIETNEVTQEMMPKAVAIELCVWDIGADSPRKATQDELDAQGDAKEAVIYAENIKQLQAVVDSAKSEIIQLEGIVDFFGIPRPVSFKSATAAANAWIEARENEGDTKNASKGGRLSTTLLALFSGLKDAGLDETKIYAVWAYMIATGQNTL